MMVVWPRMMHHSRHHALPQRHHRSMKTGCRIIRPDLQPGQTFEGSTRGFIKQGLTLKGKLSEQYHQNAEHQQPTTYRG